MASGLGPNFILPLGQQVVGNLIGNKPSTGAPIGANWFGSDPMEWGGQVMDAGRRGDLISRGPQSGTWTTPEQGAWNQIGTPHGINSALFGSSYNPSAGQGAYERFNDVGDSYLRRYGTDVRVDPANPNVTLQPMLDAQGNPAGFGQGVRPNPAYYSPNAKTLLESPERSSGQRSAALFGGRDETGAPMAGLDTRGHRTFSGLQALQQNVNPYLNDPTQGAKMSQYAELLSPFSRADPGKYLQTMLDAEGKYPSTGDVGRGFVNQAFDLGNVSVEDMDRMQGGMYGDVTGDVHGLTNAYEKQLMEKMAAEGSKDLSLGLQDAQNTMAAMGLGRSGTGQSTALGAWNDIQERNATARQNLMAQFAESAMGREASAMQSMGLAGLDANARAILAQQGGGINAMLAAQQGAIQGNESRLGRANQAAMSGQASLNDSLEASRAAGRQQLLAGLDRTQQWNTTQQGNYLQSLLGHDKTALDRMVAESQEQSRGMQDYMGLQQLKDSMYTDRLNQMLGLEDRYRTGQNEVYNQMAQYGQMPINYLMSMITGISPTGGSPARTGSWGPAIASAAIGAAPSAYSSWQNQYDPNGPGGP